MDLAAVRSVRDAVTRGARIGEFVYCCLHGVTKTPEGIIAKGAELKISPPFNASL